MFPFNSTISHYKRQNNYPLYKKIQNFLTSTFTVFIDLITDVYVQARRRYKSVFDIEKATAVVIIINKYCFN